MLCASMLQTIQLIIHATIHITVGIRSPHTNIRDGKSQRGRTYLQIVHPIAIILSILMPPKIIKPHDIKIIQ